MVQPMAWTLDITVFDEHPLWHWLWFHSLRPAALVILWISSTAAALQGLLGWSMRRALCLAPLLVVLALWLSPQPGQNLYWTAASLFHTLPLTLCGFMVWLLSPHTQTRFRLPLICALAIALCGMNEAFDLVFVPVLGLAALFRRDRLSIAAFYSAALSLGIMVAAPGNAVRAATPIGNKGFEKAIEISWRHANLIASPTTLIYLFALAALLLAFQWGSTVVKPRWWWPIVLYLASPLLTFLLIAPSVVALHAIPFARVMLAPTYVVATIWICGGLCVGLLLREKMREIANTAKPRYAFAAVGLMYVCWHTVPPPTMGVEFVNKNQLYARHIQVRDAFIFQAMAKKQPLITVPGFNLYGIPTLTTDAHHVQNQAVAYFFNKTHPPLLRSNK